ncbi:MAG TPA: anthranilate synthase component I family protein [Deltaproteobacteria bacterium]|nr:anthranilate synthase component I family protein [Deltaproteobacteria bacterium]
MSPESVVAALGPRSGVAWLDSGAADHGWSVIAWDPVQIVTDGRGWPTSGRSLSSIADARRGDDDPPFVGGVIGYLGFGVGHYTATLPPQGPTPEPELWLARYEGALCYRHRDQTWHPTGPARLRREASALLARACPLPPPPDPPPDATSRTVDRQGYEASVEQILAWIQAGDCYQVNLSRPVSVQPIGDAFGAYRRLRRFQADYGAWIQLDGGRAVLCNSPELFLAIDGRRVCSEPIKGTRPRGEDPATDARLGRQLLESSKDRAELTMIVDLVRNDLGRIASLGSVTTQARTLVSHPTVHHTAQRVSAELRPGADAWDALAATFPPGSVTGAPKVRAVQRISQLERHPRGVYCGAIGFVSDCGTARFNVAIRTAVAWGDQVRYHVGGGVVAASDPAGEWAETQDKEAALARALLPRPGP